MFDNLPKNNSNSGNQGQRNAFSNANGQDGATPQAPLYGSGQKFQPDQGPNSFPANEGAGNQATPSASVRPNSFRPIESPIEDMFSETERPEKPKIFQPKSTPPPIDQFGMADAMQLDPYTGESLKAKNKTIVFSLMLISFMLVVIAGWYAYRMFFRTLVPDLVVEDPIVEEVQSNMTIEREEVKEEVQAPIVQEKVLDTDGDGLSDNEEFQLGTNLEEADTDGDGLFDREEVKVYKTDPLDTDTDKDGFADGMEVKGGYNPNGEGKLFENNN